MVIPAGCSRHPPSYKIHSGLWVDYNSLGYQSALSRWRLWDFPLSPVECRVIEDRIRREGPILQAYEFSGEWFFYRFQMQAWRERSAELRQMRHGLKMVAPALAQDELHFVAEMWS